MKKIFLIVIVLLFGVCDNMAQRTNVIEQDLQQEIKLSKGELIKINILVHSDIEQLSTQKGVRLSQTKRKQAIMSQKNRIAQSQLTLMGQLNVLSKKPGQIFTREKLADILGSGQSPRSIDVQITRLRKKIEKDSKNPRYLQTIRGKGYMLLPE